MFALIVNLLVNFSATSLILTEQISPESNKLSTLGKKVLFVVGAQKAGTTWLREKLLLLPEFSLSKIKELHYYTQFSSTYDKSWLSQHRYDQLFDINNDQLGINTSTISKIRDKLDLNFDDYTNLMNFSASQISCDFSPEYSVLEPDIFKRILNNFPNCNFVYILRDPVDRAISQLRMQCIDIYDKEHLLEIEKHTYLLKQSSYKSNLINIQKYIPENKLLLMNYNEIKSNPVAFLNRFLDFCGAKRINKCDSKLLALDDVVFSHTHINYPNIEKTRSILLDLLAEEYMFWRNLVKSMD